LRAIRIPGSAISLIIHIIILLLSQETKSVETINTALKKELKRSTIKQIHFHSSDFKLKKIMSWSLAQKHYQKKKLWKIDSFKE
jgi:hypothetical protein